MLKIIQLVEDKLELFITTLRKYHFERNKVCVCVCVCGIHVGGGGESSYDKWVLASRPKWPK